MFKKLTLLAAAVAAFAAFGAGTASANWYHSGVALKAGENRTIHLEGTASFSSAAGGVHCATATANITATGGSTTGHATFSVASPTTCEISGGLALLCGGSTKLETVNLTSGTTVHLTAGSDNVSVTNVTLHQACANGFGFDLTSETTPLSIENIDNPKKITKGTLAGKLKTNLSSGSVTVLAHMECTTGEKETYGITAP